jgi:hypothetical protein
MNIVELVMSKTEVKSRTIRVVDLKDGETVSSATATHTPPDGETPLTIMPTVSTSPYVDVELGPFTVPGQHFVKVQAVGSADSKPEVLYSIEVKDV